MQSRTLNRRSLCKAIMAMGLIAASDRLTALGIGEAAEGVRKAAQGKESEEKGMTVSICGRRFLGDGTTIRIRRRVG